MIAYTHKEIAEIALNTVKANYITEGYEYSIENIPYSVREKSQSKTKPYEGGTPEKDIN